MKLTRCDTAGILASAAMCFSLPNRFWPHPPALSMLAVRRRLQRDRRDGRAASRHQHRQNVYVPTEASDWLVSSPITLANNNQELLFQSGVTVTAKPGAFTGWNDCLFDVTGSGVNMVGPVRHCRCSRPSIRCRLISTVKVTPVKVGTRSIYRA